MSDEKTEKTEKTEMFNEEELFNPESPDPQNAPTPPPPPVPPKQAITPINATPVQKDISKTTVNVSSDIEKSFSQLVHLNHENDVHIPTCSICGSNLRTECENLWEQQREKALPLIKELFLNKAGQKINKGVVENHMRFHVNNSIKELQKIEYADKIQRLKNNNLTTLGKLDTTEAIIMERIIGVNSIAPSSGDLSASDVEKLKTDETVKLVSSMEHILKLRATIMGEMRSSGEVITLPTKDFIRIFATAIKDAKSDYERQIIHSLLEKLKQIGK